MKHILLALFVFLLPISFAHADPLPAFGEDQGQDMQSQNSVPAKSSEDARKPHIEIWLPKDFRVEGEKFPLLVFSHGFGGCAKQSVFLTQFLADHGYVVIAPDHADANCRRDLSGGGLASRMQDMRGGKTMRPEKPFRTPEAWSDKTEADRRDDMESAIDFVLNQPKYASHIDTDHMGLIGHSLGGYTVLGMAGAWPSWKDKRFKAVLALSPYVEPFIDQRTLTRLDVPVMYQGGTRDFGITPTLKRHGGAYDQTPAPKYFIEYDGAGHFAWTQLEDHYQDVINRTSLAFLDRYLKDGKEDILPGGKDKQVITYWHDQGPVQPTKE